MTSPSDPRQRAIGLTLVVTAAVLFIINSGVSRAAMWAGIEPSVLATVRITGTFVILGLAALVFQRSALRRPRGRLVWLVLLQGVVGVAALQWTYFVAIDRLPLGLALLIEYQAPILVALWAWLVQGEQVRPRVWLGLGLAITGLAAAAEVFNGLAFDTVGLLAAAAAAICFATYFLVGEACVRQAPPLQVNLWSFAVAAVALNIVAPPRGVLDIAGTSASLQGRFADISVPVWTLLLWIIVMGTVVPFSLELFAMQHVRATTVTMLAMLEPIGVAALGWFWYGESLGPVAVLGCFTVVAGLLIAESARADHESEPALLG